MSGLLERAIKAHIREPGAMQPSAGTSGEREFSGRNYVVLANNSGVLAVYRVKPDGTLKRLKRWPAALNQE